jgi:small-conductance mechanosensitive channel
VEEQISTWANHSGLNPWLTAGIVFGLVFSILWIVKGIVWSRLGKWAKTTDTTWDDFVVERLSGPFSMLVFVASFGIAGQTAPPIVRSHPLMLFGVRVALIFVAVWMIDRFLSFFFRSNSLPDSLTTTTRALLLTVARVVLMTLGLLVVLDTIGVSITPLLASLGVGSVAVALALQDTLGNFFGGLYILADKPIRIGDFVSIEGGSQGYVDRIGWRSTRIKLPSNNTVIVPNSKIAGSQITNFDLPVAEIGFGLDLGVSYESDLEKVERITLEVAKEVLGRVPGGVTVPAPVVRFHTFADSSINFTVILRAAKFDDIGPIKHEFVKALHKRYDREGISIPYPQRVVRMMTEKTGVTSDVL